MVNVIVITFKIILGVIMLAPVWSIPVALGMEFFERDDAALNTVRFGMFVMFAETAISTITQAVS